MTTKKTIVFDCDGVLADFVGGYSKYVRDQGHHHVCHTKVTSYLFLGADFNIPEETSNDLFRGFTAAKGFEHLPVNPHARTLFSWLHEHGWKVVIATDAPTKAQDHRIEWFRKNELKYDEIVFTANKSRIVRHEQAAFVVEDKASHIMDCMTETCAEVCRVDYPWNANLAFPYSRKTYLSTEARNFSLGGFGTSLETLHGVMRLPVYDGLPLAK
jgi:5'(3')-deoxyribonucleotidase